MKTRSKNGLASIDSHTKFLRVEFKAQFLSSNEHFLLFGEIRIWVTREYKLFVCNHSIKVRQTWKLKPSTAVALLIKILNECHKQAMWNARYIPHVFIDLVALIWIISCWLFRDYFVVKGKGITLDSNVACGLGKNLKYSNSLLNSPSRSLNT